jgi:oligopeptidase A
MTDHAVVPNPLLDMADLPRFDAIRVEHIGPAVDALLSRCERALATVVAADFPADYHAMSNALDMPLQALEATWQTVRHLQGVKDSPALREAIAEIEPKITAWNTAFASDSRLYQRYRSVAGEQAERLTSAQRRALALTLQQFELSGAGLPEEMKPRFAQTMQRSAMLAREFSNHVLDATDRFAYYATPDEVQGVPQEVLGALAAAAEQDGKPGRVKLTLQQPCFIPVMQYAANRGLRETVYRASVTRASEFGAPELDNGPVIEETLALRHERAAMLGFAHHAAVSLVPKMADSAEQVITFLDGLAQRARPMAEAELAELENFARDTLKIDALAPWDIAYASEQLRRQRYAFCEQDVTNYFQLDKVLPGLFRIAESLFDVTIREEDLPAWDPAVTSYRVERRGELLGQFVLDPYARTGKRAGAWMDPARTRWRRPDDSLRTAVAYLVTNFAVPAPGSPALLRHSDVVTLFHEFGHGLHHLLSKVDTLGVSGISGVEWDAIELPSQLMENFAWEWDTLQRISSHATSGESLLKALFDKMASARNFQIGLFILRQAELALFDMRIHALPERASEAQGVMDEVRAAVTVLPVAAYNRSQNTFAHVWAGSYAAGYYSYLWADVLACDAWERFRTAGVGDIETGRRYRETILDVGGSRPMNDSFTAFVGRAPTIDALLRQKGLAP